MERKVGGDDVNERTEEIWRKERRGTQYGSQRLKSEIKE